MRKGFTINGYVFLLVLLSLFAGFYYLGGIKSRLERDVLAREAQFAQDALIHYCLVIEQQNMVINQQDSIISVLRQDAMEYSRLYRDAARGEVAARRRFEAYKDSVIAAQPVEDTFLDLYPSDMPLVRVHH